MAYQPAARAPKAKTCPVCHKGVASHTESVEERPPGEPKRIFHARCYKMLRKQRRRAERRSQPSPPPPSPLALAGASARLGQGPDGTATMAPQTPVTRADLDAIVEMLAACERRLVALEHRADVTPPTVAPPALTRNGTPRQRQVRRAYGSLGAALLPLMADERPHTLRELCDRLRAEGVSPVSTSVIATTLRMARSFRSTITYTPPPNNSPRWTCGTYTYHPGTPTGQVDLASRLLTHTTTEPFFAEDLAATLQIRRFLVTRALHSDPRFEDLGHGLFVRKDSPNA